LRQRFFFLFRKFLEIKKKKKKKNGEEKKKKKKKAKPNLSTFY